MEVSPHTPGVLVGHYQTPSIEDKEIRLRSIKRASD
jgi:hypothetical protein